LAAGNARSTMRGLVGACAARDAMSRTRAPASRISPGSPWASGRFFQYFCGISWRIIRGLSRAGLKMLA